MLLIMGMFHITHDPRKRREYGICRILCVICHTYANSLALGARFIMTTPRCRTLIPNRAHEGLGTIDAAVFEGRPGNRIRKKAVDMHLICLNTPGLFNMAASRWAMPPGSPDPPSDSRFPMRSRARL